MPTKGGIQNKFGIPDFLSTGHRLYGLGNNPPTPIHHKNYTSHCSSSPILSDDDIGTELIDTLNIFLTNSNKMLKNSL
jgi:hypothetical protein